MPSAATPTLSKKEKKQLRKQMLERKAQLLAKHGSALGRPGDGGSSDGSGGFRTFSDVQPKLPSYSPSASSRPLRGRPIIKAVTPPKPAAARRPRVVEPAPVVPSTTAHPGLDPVDADLGPGVLQRNAARIERGIARLAAVRHWRPNLRRPRLPRIPWSRLSADATAPGFGTLGTIVWPLRLCGLVAVGGAVKLALEAHSGGMSVVATALVLGMGVAVAVMILALAEIARALRHIARGVV